MLSRATPVVSPVHLRKSLEPRGPVDSGGLTRGLGPQLGGGSEDNMSEVEHELEQSRALTQRWLLAPAYGSKTRTRRGMRSTWPREKTPQPRSGLGGRTSTVRKTKEIITGKSNQYIQIDTIKTFPKKGLLFYFTTAKEKEVPS